MRAGLLAGRLACRDALLTAPEPGRVYEQPDSRAAVIEPGLMQDTAGPRARTQDPGYLVESASPGVARRGTGRP